MVARDKSQPAAMSFKVTFRPIGVWLDITLYQIRTI
jgi:hypothetical protein